MITLASSARVVETELAVESDKTVIANLIECCARSIFAKGKCKTLAEANRFEGIELTAEEAINESGYSHL